MTFLSLLLVLGAIQIWGSGAPLHKDAWFHELLAGLREQSWLRSDLVLFAALMIPLAVLGLLMALASQSLPILGPLLLNVAVLMYSLGRGDFSQAVGRYIDAAKRNDPSQASYVVDELATEASANETSDWASLNGEALRAVLYRGFERLFAVFFWFVILGAPGALLYRMSALYREGKALEEFDSSISSRWLWLMEWPAIRVLGVSWALAGNFVGCFERWKECLFCVDRESSEVLEHYVQGALSFSESDFQSEDPDEQAEVSAGQIQAAQSLLSRTLWLWLCVIAIVSLMI